MCKFVLCAEDERVNVLLGLLHTAAELPKRLKTVSFDFRVFAVVPVVLYALKLPQVSRERVCVRHASPAGRMERLMYSGYGKIFAFSPPISGRFVLQMSVYGV